MAEKENFDDSNSENSYNSANKEDDLEDILDKVADNIIAQLNSDIYIICQDDIPIYYCDNHKQAHQNYVEFSH